MVPKSFGTWIKVGHENSGKVRWNLGHGLGVLDRKHIAIKCPRNGGLVYYNYKGFQSLIFMGLVYAGYEFIWIYIGGFTSVSDVTVFNSSELKNVIESQNIGFPEAVLFPCDDRNIPCFLIGDNASPLRTCL